MVKTSSAGKATHQVSSADANVAPSPVDDPKPTTGAATIHDGVDATSTAPSQLISPTPTASSLDSSGLQDSFPITRLQDITTPTAAGAIFRLDGGFLDALRMQIRRCEDSNGERGYSINFKISGPAREAFAARLKKHKSKRQRFVFHRAEVAQDDANTVLRRGNETHQLNDAYYGRNTAPDTGANAGEALQVSGKGWKLQFIPNDGPMAMRGAVRLEVFGGEDACNQALQEATQKLGLQGAFAPPTEASLKRYAMMKLLWRRDPKAAAKLSKATNDLSTLKIATLEAKLKKAGVSQDRIDNLRYEQVTEGHFTVVDDAVVGECKAAGLQYAYSTVELPEHVVSILGQGQKATLTRWDEGAFIQGMSSMQDVGTGGAQGVFSRLVVGESDQKHWTGRRYKLLLKPELLARLDIWGWAGDEYGQSWDLARRNFGAELVKTITKAEQKQTYGATNNEIVSPVGIDPKLIFGVAAVNDRDRERLIKALKQANFTPPDGVSVEDFVRLAPKIQADLVDS